MIELFTTKDTCCGCSACMSICPSNAITMEPDEEGFLYPRINTDLCNECGLCLEVCAFQNGYDTTKNLEKPILYAVKHKSDKVRTNSTSGGAFTAISDLVLAEGGVIFGAAFDRNFRVRHQAAYDADERDSFCGSKYVQSDIESVFSEIQAALRSGLNVLFSGAGCQVAGLYSYLDRSNTSIEKLLTVDIICHGTPSPKVFADYISFIEKKRESKIARYYFRSKVNGWGFTQQIVLTNGSEDHTSALSQAFKELFLANICLRPACHACKYTNTIRPSDITISDYKGIQQVHPDFADDLGISAMILNTDKGMRKFEGFRESVISLPSNIQDLVVYELNLRTPTPANPKRDEFWSNYYEHGFDFILKEYTSYNEGVSE